MKFTLVAAALSTTVSHVFPPRDKLPPVINYPLRISDWPRFVLSECSQFYHILYPYTNVIFRLTFVPRQLRRWSEQDELFS